KVARAKRATNVGMKPNADANTSPSPRNASAHATTQYSARVASKVTVPPLPDKRSRQYRYISLRTAPTHPRQNLRTASGNPRRGRNPARMIAKARHVDR